MKYSYEQLSQQTALFLQLLSVERNLSNRTLNAYHSDLHCFMRWCRNSQVETLDQNTILQLDKQSVFCGHEFLPFQCVVQGTFLLFSVFGYQHIVK